MNIHFEKVKPRHVVTIFEWLAEPHMQEFWDNSQEHKDDIIIFANGRKEPSDYFNGIATYWIGFIDDQAFCFLLTTDVLAEQEIPPLWQEHLSKTGKTVSIDFGIGNREFLGKGLAATTLQRFTEFLPAEIDSEIDTFFIDPDVDNPRAKHVYEKAGFKRVGDFMMKQGAFIGHKTYLMVKHLAPKKL